RARRPPRSSTLLHPIGRAVSGVVAGIAHAERSDGRPDGHLPQTWKGTPVQYQGLQVSRSNARFATLLGGLGAGENSRMAASHFATRGDDAPRPLRFSIPLSYSRRESCVEMP